MEQLLVTLVGIALGAIGYVIATFWVQPILRYRDIKYRIASDLVFFANAIELEKLDGTPRGDTLQRKESNRRSAAELKALHTYLPYWYRVLLRVRKENPIEASSNLIGLSNTSDQKDAKDLISAIGKNLKLP